MNLEKTQEDVMKIPREFCRLYYKATDLVVVV